MTDIVCPFCGEKDFDLIGLKIHLCRGWCQVYDVIETPSTVKRINVDGTEYEIKTIDIKELEK